MESKNWMAEGRRSCRIIRCYNIPYRETGKKLHLL